MLSTYIHDGLKPSVALYDIYSGVYWITMNEFPVWAKHPVEKTPYAG